MPFNKEDCILIKYLYLLKEYTAWKLPKEFLSKSWKERAKSSEAAKVTEDTGSVDRRPGSDRP